MKIALFNFKKSYNIFLEELAENSNNTIYLINNINEETIINNVHYIPYNNYSNYNFDICIVNRLPNILYDIKNKLNNINIIFCLWIDYDINEDSLFLNNTMLKDFVDLYIFVNESLQLNYINRFNITNDKTISKNLLVLENIYLKYKHYIEKIYIQNIELSLCFFNNNEWKNHNKILGIINIYPNISQYNNIMLNRAVSYYKLKDYNKAIPLFKICKKINNDFNINKNLALIHFEQNNKEKFFKYCRYALELDFVPELAILMAQNLQDNNLYTEAISLYESILKLDPNNYFILNNIANIYLLFIARSNNLKEELEDIYIRSLNYCDNIKAKELIFGNWLLNNLYNWNNTDKDNYERALKWYSYMPHRDHVLLKEKDSNKFRIGYISTDFITHPVGYMFESILKNHNIELFDIFCYDNSTGDNILNKRLRSYNSKWYNIVNMSDNELLEIMVNDNLDILVDMMGHTRNNRIGILTYKPAKKIISYFAYPSTSGIKEIDYKFTDIYANPELLKSQDYFTEKLYYLENGFQCYTPPFSIESKKEYNRNNINLCCFNNPLKLSKPCFRVFAEILKRIPEAKLYLRYFYYKSSYYKEYILSIFLSLGISKDRIDIGYDNLIDGLNLYNKMDIALDPFPYNGGTISSEALYMNTPFITLAGTNYVSRVGVSLLSILGLERYIANSEEEYVEKVVSLSNNRDKLLELHNTLRERMLKTDLGDSISFTKHIEEAYIDICSKN